MSRQQRCWWKRRRGDTYTEDETVISKSNLSAVVSNVKGPVCLLGGWAVYATVNQNFSAERGRNYVGSRDIDLGFHVDETREVYAVAEGFEPVAAIAIGYADEERSTSRSRKPHDEIAFTGTWGEPF